MTFDLRQILASKRAFRHALAARAITLRPVREGASHSQVLREDPAPYRAGKKPNP